LTNNQTNTDGLYLRSACADLHFGKPAISVNDPYIPLDLVISNEGPDTYPQNTQIYFPGTPLTHQDTFPLPHEVKPNQKIKILCKLETRDGVRISDVPPHFTPLIRDSEGRTQILKNGIINMKSEAFAGNLVKLPHHYNILMFGPARSGKSTTINNIKIALSKDFSPIRRAGPYGNHIDKQYSKTNLNEYDIIAPIGVSLFDTFGLDNNTYSGKQLEMMLKGSMKLNSKMFEEIEISPSKEENKIDAVAVLVSIEQSNPMNYLHDLIKENIVKLSDMGYLPIIVLTHAQNESEEDLINAINRISDSFQVEKSSIVVTYCYDQIIEGSIPKKNFDVDIRALSLLERLILEGKTKRERDRIAMPVENHPLVPFSVIKVILFLCALILVGFSIAVYFESMRNLYGDLEKIKERTTKQNRTISNMQKELDKTKRECSKLNGLIEQYDKELKIVRQQTSKN